MSQGEAVLKNSDTRLSAEGREILLAAARDLGVELPGKALDLIALHYEQLLNWKDRFGLTSLSREDDILRELFVDSMASLSRIGQEASGKLLDIGSGAGFPGVPIAILRPQLKIFLLDSQKKKGMFLSMLCQKLGLEGVSILVGRAEDLARDPALRESFDFVMAKAVAPLRILLEISLPFLLPGGRLIAHKGPKVENELKECASAMRMLGGSLLECANYRIGAERERTLVVVEKSGATPPVYPRRVGTLKNKPL